MKNLIQLFSLLCILTSLHSVIATIQNPQQIKIADLTAKNAQEKIKILSYNQEYKTKSFFRAYPYITFGLATTGIVALTCFAYKKLSIFDTNSTQTLLTFDINAGKALLHSAVINNYPKEVEKY